MAAPEAHAQNLFGGTGRLPYKDITGSEELRGLSLDYDYIEGGRASYRAVHGVTGAPTTEIRRNYVYVEDTDGTLTIPYRNGDDIYESFNFALNETYSVLPNEFLFVYLFTSFETGIPAFFYSPEANTTRGMGEQIFDQNGPNEVREGFVFMNDWTSFEGITGGGSQFDLQYARAVFNQEAGHRWCCFIQLGAGAGGAGQDILLGRDDSHWSYFMHSNGSPMEGNAWSEVSNNTFRTTTGFDNFYFSELDRYLMGFIPASDVQPFFVITQPQFPSGTQDLYGQALNKASPPQIVDPITVTGNRIERNIQDVIDHHGPRLPAYGDAPTKFRVVFIMLASRARKLTETQKVNFENMVDDYAEGFAMGSDRRGELDYLLIPKTPLGGPCAEHSDCTMGDSCLKIPPADPNVGMCTHACTLGGSECPSGFCCGAASSGTLVCLTDAVCQTLPPPDSGIPADCMCNVTADTCDQGCACDMACVVEPPDAGMNNNTGDKDAGAGGGEECACDVSYSCDGSERVPCDCDPECGLKEDDGGCATTEIPADRTGIFLLLGAALFLVYKKKR